VARGKETSRDCPARIAIACRIEKDEIGVGLAWADPARHSESRGDDRQTMGQANPLGKTEVLPSQGGSALVQSSR